MGQDNITNIIILHPDFLYQRPVTETMNQKFGLFAALTVIVNQSFSLRAISGC